MNVHAPMLITCGRCDAALAGVTMQYGIVWQREQLTAAQANFADCAALLTSQSATIESLPASVIAKLDLPECSCVPARPMLSRTITAPAPHSARFLHNPVSIDGCSRTASSAGREAKK